MSAQSPSPATAVSCAATSAWLTRSVLVTMATTGVLAARPASSLAR